MTIKSDAPEAARQLDLKAWPVYFEAVMAGIKPFEVRKNDRDYRRGDILRLLEWSPVGGYTGRSVKREVTYVLTGCAGLMPEYVVLGLIEVPNG